MAHLIVLIDSAAGGLDGSQTGRVGEVVENRLVVVLIVTSYKCHLAGLSGLPQESRITQRMVTHRIPRSLLICKLGAFRLPLTTSNMQRRIL
jgi:hypothetical protein